MAKAFSAIKSRLGLFSFFTFGKYDKCRVDSILEQDPEYVLFLAYRNKLLFEKVVIDIAIEKTHSEPIEEEIEEVKEINFDDVPF